MRLVRLILIPLALGSGLKTVADDQDCGISLRGSLTQGGLLRAQAPEGASVTLNDAAVKISPDGAFVFGFARDAEPQAILRVTRPNDTVCTRTLTIATRAFDIERVDGLPPKTVTPPPEWLERRKEETGRVRAARAINDDRRAWQQDFIRPAEGRYSGFYGSQRILNGQPRSPHYGLDIAGPVGAPIVAPAAGIVRLAAPDFLLEGGIVIIDHGFGVTSTLFHLQSVEVSEGQAVAQGDQIGTMGATGRASGPHVDWRINWGAVRLDPLLVLEDEG